MPTAQHFTAPTAPELISPGQRLGNAVAHTVISPEGAPPAMPQSLSKVLVHLIFSTKQREPLIGPEIRPRLHAYIIGILDHLSSPSLQTGGVADHIHTLFVLGRTTSQADLVEEVKKSSSKWMKADGGVPGFSWQAGYGALPRADESLRLWRETRVRPLPPAGYLAPGRRVVAPLARDTGTACLRPGGTGR